MLTENLQVVGTVRVYMMSKTHALTLRTSDFYTGRVLNAFR